MRPVLLYLYLSQSQRTDAMINKGMNIYTKAPAKEISVFDYTQVLFASLLSLCVLGQVPDLLSIAGYVIIIGTAVFKWKKGLKKENQVDIQRKI